MKKKPFFIIFKGYHWSIKNFFFKGGESDFKAYLRFSAEMSWQISPKFRENIVLPAHL